MIFVAGVFEFVWDYQGVSCCSFPLLVSRSLGFDVFGYFGLKPRNVTLANPQNMPCPFGPVGCSLLERGRHVRRNNQLVLSYFNNI